MLPKQKKSKGHMVIIIFVSAQNIVKRVCNCTRVPSQTPKYFRRAKNSTLKFPIPFTRCTTFCTPRSSTKKPKEIATKQT